MIYRIVCIVCRFALFFLFRIKVVGTENIPKSGGAIMAANHRSNWDVIIMAVFSPRKLRFMAKAEMFKNKFIAGFLKQVGAFPVQRGRGDVGAIKSAISKLREEHIVLMFPEGRRMKKGEEHITDAKAGITMLATRAEVPVLPAQIVGDYKWMKKITIVFGEPIYYDEYYNQKLTMEQLQDMSNDVLRTLRKLDTCVKN